MVTLSTSATVLLGMVMALWLVGGGWALATGLKLRRRAVFSADQASRLATLLESAPAIPLIVRNDGRVEAQERLVTWLGLQRLPNFLSDLSLGDLGLTPEDMQALSKDVATVQRTARPFNRTIVPRGGNRTLMIRGLPAGGLAAAARPPGRTRHPRPGCCSGRIPSAPVARVGGAGHRRSDPGGDCSQHCRPADRQPAPGMTSAVAAIVPAAGLSRRMGRCQQTSRYW